MVGASADVGCECVCVFQVYVRVHVCVSSVYVRCLCLSGVCVTGGAGSSGFQSRRD